MTKPSFQDLVREGYQLQLPLPLPPGIKRPAPQTGQPAPRGNPNTGSERG